MLFGVAFITLIGEVLKPLGSYDVIAYGALLITVIIFFPRGLLDRHRRHVREPENAGEAGTT